MVRRRLFMVDDGRSGPLSGMLGREFEALVPFLAPLSGALARLMLPIRLPSRRNAVPVSRILARSIGRCSFVVAEHAILPRPGNIVCIHPAFLGSEQVLNAA